MKIGLPGLLHVRSWPQSVRAFLLGFLLVAGVVAVVGVFAAPLPMELSAEDRAVPEAGGAARGRYLAQQDALKTAIERAPRLAADRIDALFASGNFQYGYRPTYLYAWNDAVDQLSRRVPNQLRSEEAHTQWIELLR